MTRHIFVLLTVCLFSCAAFAGDVYVRGYYRSNGTYVAPHYRSSPDGVFSNNWSTVGNINPYTGKLGTRIAPDTDYDEWRQPSSPKAVTENRPLNTQSRSATTKLNKRRENIQRTSLPITKPTLAATTANRSISYEPSKAKSSPTNSNSIRQHHSPLVSEAQEYLNYLGFNVGIVDGILGSRTRAAVYAYQRTRSLIVSGDIDEALLEKMSFEIDAYSKKTAAKNESLTSGEPSKNSSGELIERTQFYLKTLGLYDGFNNGIKDTELEHAIMRFQSSNRISVDGLLSPQLLSSIKSKLYNRDGWSDISAR